MTSKSIFFEYEPNGFGLPVANRTFNLAFPWSFGWYCRRMLPTCSFTTRRSNWWTHIKRLLSDCRRYYTLHCCPFPVTYSLYLLTIIYYVAVYSSLITSYWGVKGSKPGLNSYHTPPESRRLQASVRTGTWLSQFCLQLHLKELYSLIIGITYIKDLQIKKVLGEAIMKLTGTSLKKYTLPLAAKTVHSLG